MTSPSLSTDDRELVEEAEREAHEFAQAPFARPRAANLLGRLAARLRAMGEERDKAHQREIDAHNAHARSFQALHECATLLGMTDLDDYDEPARRLATLLSASPVPHPDSHQIREAVLKAIRSMPDVRVREGTYFGYGDGTEVRGAISRHETIAAVDNALDAAIHSQPPGTEDSHGD